MIIVMELVVLIVLGLVWLGLRDRARFLFFRLSE